MEDTRIDKKEIDKETEKLIRNITNEIIHSQIKDELKYFRHNISNIVATYMFNLKESQKKLFIEDREDMAEHILKKYYPLKVELKNIKTTLLNNTNIEEEEDEFFEKLMTTEFKNIEIGYEEKLSQYLGLKQVFDFIDKSINSYIDKLKEDNEKLEKIIEENYEQRINDRIGRNERKIYILENLYKEGIPAKQIKYDIYENERRYAYDKKELLSEIAPYFSSVYAIINLF